MPFVRNNQSLQHDKHHGQFLKALISLLSVALALILALPTFGGSIGLGLGLKVATLLAGEAVSAFTATVITGVVAGLMEATIQGVLVGFGVKEFSAAEAISAGFAAMGSIWAGSAGSVASVSESSMSELLTETAVKAASINIAEQLALMALNKLPHLDFKQVAASILGAAIDPQVSKLIPTKSPLAQMTMHTFSGTMVNTALYHKYDAEFLAAQLLSNVIVNTAAPAIVHGLSHLNQTTLPTPQKQATQAPRPLHAPEKKGYATKENVHQVAKPAKPAMKPDAFMRQMGIDDLLVDYQDALNDFYHEESYESYIPSVDAGVFGAKSVPLRAHGFIDYCEAFNRAVENSRDGLVNMIRHPIDTLEGLGTFAFDGANAVTNLAFGFSSQGSRARNAMRSVLINDAISTFNNGDSLTRFEMISEVGSGIILGGAIGGPATQVVGKLATLASRSEVALSTSRYAFFPKKRVDFGVDSTAINSFKLVGEYDAYSLGNLSNRKQVPLWGENILHISLKRI